MNDWIVVISGNVCAGKTTLAEGLVTRFSVKHVTTSQCIRELRPKVPRDRRELQKAGAALDRETKGRWVANALAQRIDNEPRHQSLFALDCVRTAEQVSALRRQFGQRIVHVHLTADRDELSRRYLARTRTDIDELVSYEGVLADPVERAVPTLGAIADVIIDTQRCTERDVLLRAASHIGLLGRQYKRSVDVLVGGQYGSEGKGQVAAYLSPEYDMLVRVGGPNAGHKVWTETGPITFHHLPSGTTSNPVARIVLGAGAVVRTEALLKEIRQFKVDSERLSIDPQAFVISDADIETERNLRKAIGSTGQGVGAASARRITERSLARDSCALAANDPQLKQFIKPAGELLEDAYANGHRVMLEGTQGTALSLYHGDYPYVTSRETSVAGCLADAGISPARVRRIVMVCRTYPIRVQSPHGGTSGEMSREISWEEIARRSRISLKEIRQTEKTSTTNRPRRVGEFDWSLLRSSASLNAPTDIALTFVDYLNISNRDAYRIDQLDNVTQQFVEEVERVAMAPVSLLSVRFHARAIIDRRRW